MAKGLKTAGLREVDALRRRVARQLSLQRIQSLDAVVLNKKLDDIGRHISEMEERENGQA